MARGVALAGSLVVHGAIAAAFATRAAPVEPGEPPPTETEIAIEIVSPPAHASSPPASSPGAAIASSSPVSAAMPRAMPATPLLATRHAAASAMRTRAPSRADITMRIESSGPGGDELAGDGDGHRGSGIGFGDGSGIVTPDVVAPPLPPPPEPVLPAPSQARPPHLIYPTRSREIGASSPYVAQLTIDTEGFVVGARLVRGVGGALDDQTENALWRFRYRPALDDDGRPIKVTIEQPFFPE